VAMPGQSGRRAFSPPTIFVRALLHWRSCAKPGAQSMSAHAKTKQP